MRRLSNQGFSQFIAGLLVGVFLATVGFTFVSRVEVASSSGKVLKLGHSLDQNHPVHLAMVRMAELVRKKSAGELAIQIFPNGQLGDETECLEQVQNGALAMTKVSTAPLESFVPEMAVFGVPYAFRDDEHFWEVLHGDVGKELLASGEDVGLHGLCYYDAGARSFYTVRTPILNPEDLQGLKVRVQQSKTSMDMAEALGASPTPIPFGELYTALQQAMVDGAENNPPSFYTSQHFEVCKHYSLDEHTMVPDILLMNKGTWDSLSPSEQAWLTEAADESSEYQRELWRKESDKSIEAVQEEGVTIHYPDKAPFVEEVKTMHESYEGTPVGELLERIQ